MRVPAEAVMVIVLRRAVRVPRVIVIGVIVIAVRVAVIGVAVRRVAAVLLLSNARAHTHDLTPRTLTSPRAPNQEQPGTISRGSVAQHFAVPNNNTN